MLPGGKLVEFLGRGIVFRELESSILIGVSVPQTWYHLTKRNVGRRVIK